MDNYDANILDMSELYNCDDIEDPEAKDQYTNDRLDREAERAADRYNNG